MDEAKHDIEWTAAETDLETGENAKVDHAVAKGVGCDLREIELRALLSVQAKGWSDKVMDVSGLL